MRHILKTRHQDNPNMTEISDCDVKHQLTKHLDKLKHPLKFCKIQQAFDNSTASDRSERHSEFHQMSSVEL